MIAALASSGEATSTELSSRFPISRQAVSKHLGALTDAGLVVGRREGREVKLRFDPRPLEDAMAWMTKVSSQWDRRLAALQARAASRGASAG
jgi:DNA-binding transcriptional ArsR family regulator